MKHWLLVLVWVLALPVTALAYDPIPQTSEDSAHVDLEKLIRNGCRRIDTAASSANLSGDWSTLNCDSTGRLHSNTELPDPITPTATGMAIPASAPWVLGAMACYNGTTLDLCLGSSNIAHDATAAAANPLLMGGYANAAAPTDVTADLDSVRAWYLRNGAAAIQPTFAGILATIGAGVTGTGVQRVIEASDSQLSAGVGAIADAAVAAGGTGSITGKLRQISTDIDAIKTAVQLIDDDQTGTSINHLASAATTNKVEIKATAGRLMWIQATNTNAAVRYLRCSNLTAANTTPGTSAVFYGTAIPGAATGGGFNFSFGSNGLAFTTALTCWLVTEAAETGITAVALNEITWNIGYK